jgi:hypothetical protein
MTGHRYLAIPATRLLVTAALTLVFTTSTATAQGGQVLPARVAPFLGTWAITMTEPEALKGSQQTIRIWDKDGVVAASLQVGKFPALTVTGIFKDGDMLVLTVSRDARPGLMENGAPISAVISLVRDGDTLMIAQMLERSQTIKRGIGRKLPN